LLNTQIRRYFHRQNRPYSGKWELMRKIRLYFEVLFPFLKLYLTCSESGCKPSLKRKWCSGLATLVTFFTTIGLKINVYISSTINS
jgi:hypothetical protein